MAPTRELPARPSPRQEKAALAMFLAFAPRLKRIGVAVPPKDLLPFEQFEIRRARRGPLPATFFPAKGEARGAVLFIHPWIEWGQAYFHRRGRIEAARAAGYHAMTFDLPGFGGTSRAQEFFDIDIAEALAALRERAPGLRIHVWGVSSGGYWAHAVIARGDSSVDSAIFEDVTPHLFEWSARMAPLWMPCYWLFRILFPGAYRFMDLRGHAPYMRLRSTAYVSGEADRGIHPDNTRELAALTGGHYVIVPGAAHLGAIKREPQSIVDLALRTFAE